MLLCSEFPEKHCNEELRHFLFEKDGIVFFRLNVSVSNFLSQSYRWDKISDNLASSLAWFLSIFRALFQQTPLR